MDKEILWILFCSHCAKLSLGIVYSMLRAAVLYYPVLSHTVSKRREKKTKTKTSLVRSCLSKSLPGGDSFLLEYRSKSLEVKCQLTVDGGCT